MAQVINTNSLSLLTQNNLNKSQSSLGTAIERLSSGLRINSAKDDAAGQAIANRFTSNIKGLNQASRNANDGISVAQTTEGSLSEINNNLQRIRELSVQASTGSNSGTDLSSIQDEIASRLSEIDRVSGQTQFNGVKVLANDTSMKIQVGANDGETISIDLQKIDSSTLGLNGFSVSGNALKTSAPITQVGSAGNLKNVDLAAVASTLKVDAGTLQLKNVQSSSGASTGTYVVSSGSDNYAVSVDDATGKVTLNTSDVSYTDTKNGVTAGSMASQLVKVGSDSSGNAVGFVTVQGKNYTSSTGAISNGGATATTSAASAVGDIASATNAKAFAGASSVDPLATIDAAIAKVDKFRSSLGAVQNRLDSAITNLGNTSGNLSSAQSRIQDADYATEVSNMSRAQILQQAGTSVLAQANQVPQGVLSLLR
ncbi:FliC/FljB family flagellin [Buttiauxella sp. B2]|uniref:FliC/FljB family flagellin n=1 Tax=Buttiauxella sp. B2 TaxID=2587812 RepID=UPI0011210BC3|nr:FliC/FljB family flagellin [Buttiauxella sp. B2]TNV22992.1 FliC/FljB family flagellin [Buttiauxella sp. B2]